MYLELEQIKNWYQEELKNLENLPFYKVESSISFYTKLLEVLEEACTNILTGYSKNLKEEGKKYLEGLKNKEVDKIYALLAESERAKLGIFEITDKETKQIEHKKLEVEFKIEKLRIVERYLREKHGLVPVREEGRITFRNINAA